MKICLPLCLSVLLGGIIPASGQAPAAAPHPHSLSLNVEPISTGGSSTISTGTQGGGSSSSGSYGSYKSTKTETTTARESVQITVRNFGHLPDTVQVEWFFVAAPAKLDLTVPVADQQFIFDKGSKSVTIAPGGTQAFPANSAEISSERKRSSSKSRGGKGGKKAEAEETGSVLGGWMVRIVADGKTLDSRGSKDKLAEIVKDDARLGAMKKD